MPTIHFCKVYYNSPYVRLLLRLDIPDCNMVVVSLTTYWEYDVFGHNDHVTSQMSFILQIMVHGFFHWIFNSLLPIFSLFLCLCLFRFPVCSPQIIKHHLIKIPTIVINSFLHMLMHSIKYCSKSKSIGCILLWLCFHWLVFILLL